MYDEDFVHGFKNARDENFEIFERTINFITILNPKDEHMKIFSNKFLKFKQKISKSKN
jgi:hypothetical protein